MLKSGIDDTNQLNYIIVLLFIYFMLILFIFMLMYNTNRKNKVFNKDYIQEV